MEPWQGLQPEPASGVTKERAGEFELKQYVCEGLQGRRRYVGAKDGSSGMPDAQSSYVQMETTGAAFLSSA